MNKHEFIKSKGWYQWYNENYWCHSQFDTEQTDCTNWGMSLDEAYKFETDIESKKNTLTGMVICFVAKKIIGTKYEN